MGQAGKGSEPLRHVAAFIAVYRPYLWTVVVYAAFVGLLALATPVAVQALVNTAAFGTVLQPIVVLVALLLLGLVFAGVLKALKSWVVEVLQRRVFIDGVARLTYLLPRLDTTRPEARALANPVHRFFELFTIQKAVASLLLGGVDVILAALVGLAVLAFYHPMLLAFDVVLMLSMIGIVFGLGRGGVQTSVAESSAKYELADFLAETHRAEYAFRDEAGERYARARLDAVAADYLAARAAHFRVVLRQFAGALATQALASAALLGLGGYLVLERELSLGQLVAAELIVTVVVSALSDLGKYLETYYDLVTGVYKLDGLLDLAAEESPEQGFDAEVTEGPAELRIRELHLSLAGRPLYQGVELVLEKGSRVSLLGAAESGKSMLLSLLYGARRADRGVIQLDGIDSREMPLNVLRQRVAVVSGPEVIAGSVLDNVLLGRKDIPVGRVRALLDELGLSEELARLPDGLDSWIGAGGARLSPSQAMRLTLARAMIRRPGLLAIDADMSNVDPRGLARIGQLLTSPGAPWTLLMVGEVARLCQIHEVRVVRLEGGKVVDEGEASWNE